MLRIRSTVSQKSNTNNNNNPSPSHSPTHTRMTVEKSSMHQEQETSLTNDNIDEDPDGDLRSLLSGDSLGELRAQRNPHRQQSQSQQSSQSQGSQGSQANISHTITHLPSQGSSSGDIDNNSIMNTNANAAWSFSKNSLWILGTIILAVGFLGPSGLLWEYTFHDSSTSAHDRFSDNQQQQQQQLHMGHGDKHHQLAPPSNTVSEKINNNILEENQYVHPMIRSATAMERATATASRHTKFGDRKKNNNQWPIEEKKGRNKAKNNKRGIKHAIDNIDKVFLDNHPKSVGTTRKKNRAVTKEQEDDDTALSADDELTTEEFLPVIHATDDETLPSNADALDAYTYSLPASDALECRASVVAFVINATDVRDECDGLRKAFDKTCSVHASQGQGQGGGGAASSSGSAAADAAARGSAGVSAGTQHVQRRRRLSEWGQPHLWNLIPEAFHRQLQKAGGKMKSHLKRRLSESNNYHHGMKRSTNRTLHEASSARKLSDRRREDDMEDEDEDQEAQKPVVVQHPPKEEVAPPLVSLNIPTADKHISEQMLNDALLLQESSEQQAIQPATSIDTQEQLQQQHQVSAGQQTHPNTLEAVSSSQYHDPILSQQSEAGSAAVAAATAINPNITAGAAEAVHDAAESAEAIRTAVEGVKNVMNDPKSIEARTCCASILSVFHEHCDPTTTGVEDYSDRRLLVVVFVITVCGIVKSLIRHLNIRWLPEAGGCILVGVFGYLILQHMPHVQFAFDGDMFLRIMVPPIVFEAAVKINKQSFRRHVVPITIFAIVGTLASTAFTAFILHKGSSMLGHYVTVIPIRESLIFGALISSIDPIAVLSVLNNMGMTDTDTIYVVIFGEALLNDGVAIVLFQTLVHFLDETLVIDSDVVLDAFMHFIVVALGSITVGMASGACATVYFALMHGCQTPMVEVIMFCCWSFIPYYICDMVEWSGIVAIVANGFIMDLYVIGQNKQQQHGSNGSNSVVDEEIDFLVNGGTSSNNGNSNRTSRHNRQGQRCRSIFSYEGHLSPKADTHVHFVIEIFATLMETAIFAYLGLFLFSSRYHWSVYLSVLSIFATVMGRLLMIPLFSHVANIFNRISLSRNNRSSTTGLNNNGEGVHIDRRMQLVLVFAGLRGAMSFALVEHIPMFDTTTGQGSRFKPELKAMTSASVIFTLFVLGGSTSYLMEKLGYIVNKQQQQQDAVEIAPLMQHHDKRQSPIAVKRHGGLFNDTNNSRKSGSVRQRGGPR